MNSARTANHHSNAVTTGSTYTSIFCGSTGATASITTVLTLRWGRIRSSGYQSAHYRSLRNHREYLYLVNWLESDRIELEVIEMAGGRPSDYKPEYADQATKLCLLLGATDKQLADFFEVAESTINLWKLEHPKFSESLRAGKRVADAEVAQSLFNRARGAQYTTTQPFKVKSVKYDDKGKKVSENEEVISVPVDVVEPPDTNACSLWLRNRNPEQWRDRREITGDGGGPVQIITSIPRPPK